VNVDVVPPEHRPSNANAMTSIVALRELGQLRMGLKGRRVQKNGSEKTGRHPLFAHTTNADKRLDNPTSLRN
jgi:hypothetical protein